MGLGAAAAALVLMAPGASAAQVVKELRFKASDGVSLYATVSGAAPLRARPLVVEYSPYGEGPGGPPAGARFNYVRVHARGTGRSEGTWDIMGPREQKDIAESLRFFCSQPWSAGRIGLYGFSASAIAAYYAMRRTQLPCVKTASLLAGTSSTYRDLIYIGGMPNTLPAAVVLTGIGAGALANLPGRLGDSPLSAPGTAAGGLLQILGAKLSHATRDAFWRAREFPGPNGPPDVPILAATGFYDVESRGPFENFKASRASGSHLLVIGAHDGPAGRTGGAQPQFKRWFEHYLLGADNGIDREPAVQLYVGNGGHAQLRRGSWTKVSAGSWPVPGTAWRSLDLSARRSRSATSVNDGALALEPSPRATSQSAPTLPSNTFATDPYTTSTVTSIQGDNLTEATSLTYTTPRLSEPVMSVGPAALKVRLKSTAPETDIVAVLSDVAPNGASTAVAAGRLRSTFTRLDRSRSVIDRRGKIVQPYNDLSAKQRVPPGQARDYYVEFWPIGNRFAPGHRIRLTLAGTPISFDPSVPALNSIVVGGPAGAQLQFPVLPGSDLCGALGAQPCPVKAPGRTTAAARPSLRGLRLSRKRFRSARHGKAIVPRGRRLGRRVGTRARYRLSSRAPVTFRVQRARRARGRLIDGRCVRRTRRNRHRRSCTRYRTLRGKFTHRGRRGTNRFRWSGRLPSPGRVRGRRLRRGRYRLIARTRDRSGHRSRQVRARFRIVRR